MANFFDDEPVRTPAQPTGVDPGAVDPYAPQPRAAPPGNFFDDEKTPSAAPSTAAAPAPTEFNRPFGELKSRVPSWSEYFAGKGSDILGALGADPYTATRLSKGVLSSAQLFPPIGAAVAGADVAHYAGQGEPGKAALSAIGVAPAAPYARGVLQEARTLAPNFADTAKGELLRRAPTGEQLMTKGAGGFEEYRNLPMTYSQQNAQQLVTDLRGVLANKTTEGNKITTEAVDKFADKVKNKPFITPKDIDDLRVLTSDATKKGESAAMPVRSAIYDHLQRGGDTTMKTAVENYGAGKRAEIVETILSKAERAKNPDVALSNQLRSGVQRLEQRPRGFTDKEIEALDRARAGSRGVRTAEGAASALTGSPLGLGGQISVPTAAGALGFHMFGPPGAALAGVPSSVAFALRKGAGAARLGAAQEAADVVAQRSPLFLEQQAAAKANPIAMPGTPGQDWTMRNAIAQELLRRNNGGY